MRRVIIPTNKQADTQFHTHEAFIRGDFLKIAIANTPLYEVKNTLSLAEYCPDLML